MTSRPSSISPRGSLCQSPAVNDLDLSPGPISRGTPRIVLLHHFQNLFPELQLHLLGRASPNSILSLGLARSFLLDAVLSVAASHLRHCHTIPESRHESRVAEHFHQALAIKGFRRALAQSTLDQQTADALVLTCMLLNILAFSFNDENENSPTDSWILCPGDPHRLGWFSLQLGLKPLLAATEKFRGCNTMLAWMYQPPNHSISQPDPLLPAHWEPFFNKSDPDDSILLEPARMLACVRNAEPRPESFILYVQFIGTLDMNYRFRDMLEARDERAIWLLGYWLGLMCRFGWWWMRTRVNSEWRAVCLWLDQRGVRERPGEEGRDWKELMSELERAGCWPMRVDNSAVTSIETFAT